MLRAATIVLASTIAALCLAPNAAAQEREKKKPAETVSGGFSASEHQIFDAYFAEHAYDVEPLPPGIVKKLARGKPLPPGIAKRRLPTDLAAQLPERPGVEITIFGDRIVLLEASGLVIDIIEGILR